MLAFIVSALFAPVRKCYAVKSAAPAAQANPPATAAQRLARVAMDCPEAEIGHFAGE